MLALKHEIFRPSPQHKIYWTVGAAVKDFERVRGRAEEFAGSIGAENVVSVNETHMPQYTVTVWYRTGLVAKPARVDEFSGDPTFD